MEETQKLKQELGKDLVILGSGMLVAELTRVVLIDQYQLMVNPIVLGQGNPFFSFDIEYYPFHYMKIIREPPIAPVKTTVQGGNFQ